jgi:hypothetical protein
MILGTYDETYGPLLEDQWLLKLREGSPKTGFLSKLTQKGELPVKFKDWGVYRSWDPATGYYASGENLPVYVWEETYRSGWKLKKWRIGKSQEWAVMQHPEGFILEIYLTNFLDIVLNETVDQGMIVGEFKWKDNKLYKKP